MPVIGKRTSQENNTLELANLRARYIGNKPKPSKLFGVKCHLQSDSDFRLLPKNFFHQFTAIAPKRDRSKPFEVNLNTYRWSKRSLTICKLPFWLNDSNSCIRNHIRVCHIHETRWPRDFNSDISTFSSQSKMCCKRALTQIVCTGTDFLRLQDGGNCQSGWITLSKLKPNIFYVSKAFQA